MIHRVKAAGYGSPVSAGDKRASNPRTWGPKQMRKQPCRWASAKKVLINMFDLDTKSVFCTWYGIVISYRGPRPETRLVFLTEGSFCGSKTPRGAPSGKREGVFETAKRPLGQKNNAEFLCRVYEYFFLYQVQNTDLVSRSNICI